MTVQTQPEKTEEAAVLANDQGERNQVFLDLVEGVLIARIEMQSPSPDAEFAFYLQRNGRRIETRWYTGESQVQFATPPQPGRYRAIGFVRIDGETQMISSTLLRCGAPRPRGGLRLIDLPIGRGELFELDRLLPESDRARLDLRVPSLPYEFQCLLIRKKSDRLFVILGGAVGDRTRTSLPRFNRFSWAPEFPGSVLCIADPTLMLDDHIRLGWYFGHEHADATTGLTDVVVTIAQSLLRRDQIVTYGSSGGGFAAMQLAARIGEEATAIAINAQTDILKFAQKVSIDKFLSVCTDGMDADRARKSLGHRLSLIDAWQTPVSSSARCLLVQNKGDHHHLDEHLLPFANAFSIPMPGNSTDGRMGVMLYYYPNGHGPEPRSMLPEIFKRMRKLCIPAS